jgi:hypothetical protein
MYMIVCVHVVIVCALNLFPVGSAENEESSSDVQAEGGKPSGMYCYLYYSVWVCQRHRSATSCISDNLCSMEFTCTEIFSLPFTFQSPELF